MLAKLTGKLSRFRISVFLPREIEVVFAEEIVDVHDGELGVSGAVVATCQHGQGDGVLPYLGPEECRLGLGVR